MKIQVVPKPLTEKSIWRKVIAFIFGKDYACSYCGKFYTAKCHTEKINLLFPVPQNGKCCPDGHEGYTEIFSGYGIARFPFDFVKNPPPIFL